MTHTEFKQLLSSVTAPSPSQMRRLREQLDRRLEQAQKPSAQPSAKRTMQVNAARPKKRMTEAEFQQHLLKIGLLTSLPDPSLDLDDDDPDDAPVTIEGEPLSETIIRERR
jgi:hypothetical protein